MSFYTVFSKHPSASDWQVERTFGVESYAKEVADYLQKSGKLTKIVEKE